MPMKKRDGAKPWVDPDDAPELTDAYFRRADVYEGEKLVRRGRPRLERPKEAIKLRLPGEVLDYFRATGRGWQTRISEVLEKDVAREVRRGAGRETLKPRKSGEMAAAKQARSGDEKRPRVVRKRPARRK